VSGSLRAASMNSAVIRAAAGCAVRHHSVSEVSVLSLRDIPLFDEDVEEQGDPPAVAAAKRAVRAADGLFVATPEYNGALSGVLKNAVDWLSRPWGSSPLTDKPVVTVSVAPGSRGGRRAQETLREILDELGAWVIPHELLAISGTRDLFDAKGEVADAGTQARLDALVAVLVAGCAGQRSLTAEYRDLLDGAHVEDRC
jgi:chromate reductase, NAD(P)H dehydrogenase (quinone)